MLVILLRACFCLFIFICATPVQAYDDAYLPLGKKLLAKRIKQRLLCDPLQAGMRQVVFENKTKIEISAANTLLINGYDKGGKPWSFAAAAWGGCASVWTADLDKNGMEDLILALRTTTGAKPPSQLIVLMFEKNGRPFPWATDGYFDVDNKGIKDLLDTDNNGKAELIRQSQDDGYWITSLYEASRSRWHRLHSIDGVSLPLYTRYTYASNKTAIKPPEYRHPFEADLSNDCNTHPTSSSRQFINSVEFSPSSNHSGVPCFLLSDGRRIRPQYWYASMSIVLDEPSGRKMALLSEQNAIHKLACEISLRRIPVLLSGSRTRAGQRNLSSELIFAQSKARKFTAQAFNTSGRNMDIALVNNDCPP